MYKKILPALATALLFGSCSDNNEPNDPTNDKDAKYEAIAGQL